MTRPDDEGGGIGKLARGFRARTLVTAKLAGKMGIAYAKKTLGRTGATEPAPEEDPRAADRAAELVAQLGSLKGLVMKLGQMASYLPGSLPPQAQRVLAKLQSESTSMAWERIDEVVRAELGGAPDELFADFERTPFAAASIGQVHRARLDGRRVAVKVQYPEIDKVLESDLSTVGLLSRLSFLGSAIDGGEVVGELRARLLEECDYEREARQQAFFQRLLAGRPGVHVPEVIPARSARRVLTTELVENARGFYPFLDGGTREAKDRAAQHIFRTSFDCIFRHCVYNADPHPGNYLFADDGGVTFLDFGCVRRFDADFIDRWKAFALTVVTGNRAAFPDRLRAIGIVGGKKFDFEYQWRVTQYLYRPFLEPGFRYTQDYVRESYDLMIFSNPNRFTSAMPPEWLFLNRLQWGLNSVLAHLEAQGPWGELWRAAVESPTEPLDIR